MRHAIYLLVLLPAVLPAEVIDRIAVVVGTNVITESEVNRQIRVAAMLNGEEPVFTPDARRRAADMLVEQMLIRREMRAAPGAAGGPETPAVDPQVETVLKVRYPSQQQYQAALARYKLTEAEVRGHLAWQSNLIRFVDMRFRPGVQVPEPEMREYYESIWLPEWQGAHPGAKPPKFEDARDEVEKQMLAERANQALDRWIGQSRTQTRIVYRQEAFR